MRIRFVAVLCAVIMLLACCLAPERLHKLVGTWVVYAGGIDAADVLRFDEDGTGEAYLLPEDYEKVWLQGEPVPDELLVNPTSFQWSTTGDEDDQLKLTYEDGRTQTFELTYEADQEGTGLPGINLDYGIGCSGYVQVAMEE